MSSNDAAVDLIGKYIRTFNVDNGIARQQVTEYCTAVVRRYVIAQTKKSRPLRGRL